jgi:hypothetical protein
MAWLVRTAIALFIVGFFVPGRAGVALCIAGLVGLFVGVPFLARSRRVRKASIDRNGNFVDTSDVAGHDIHDGDH